MRLIMGIETKTTVKILIGLLSAIGLVILSAAVNSWVASEVKKNEKIDKVYDHILVNSKNDSLQDSRLKVLEIELSIHKTKTEESVSKIWESMYYSQKQLSATVPKHQLNQN